MLWACESTDETAPPAQEQRVADPNYNHIVGEAQGTTYSIRYKSKTDYKPAVDSLLEAFDYSLSTYNPSSLISEFNGYGVVKPDAHFREVFLLSKKIHKLTGGAFNPAVFPILELWGFNQENAEIVTKLEVDSLLPFCNFDDIYLDTTEEQLLWARNSNDLDFNAIAQGYSVDLVAGFLTSNGITDYMVEIGGEIVCSGLNAYGEPWVIGIEQPVAGRTTEDFVAKLSLADNGLATSGNYRKFKEIDGKRYSHVIDPVTGYPADNNLLSVSVTASTAAEADAFATAFMVMGLNKSIAFLEGHPELGLEALFIYDEHGAYATYKTNGLAVLASE